MEPFGDISHLSKSDENKKQYCIDCPRDYGTELTEVSQSEIKFCQHSNSLLLRNLDFFPSNSAFIYKMVSESISYIVSIFSYFILSQ